MRLLQIRCGCSAYSASRVTRVYICQLVTCDNVAIANVTMNADKVLLNELDKHLLKRERMQMMQMLNESRLNANANASNVNAKRNSKRN